MMREAALIGLRQACLVPQEMASPDRILKVIHPVWTDDRIT